MAFAARIVLKLRTVFARAVRASGTFFASWKTRIPAMKTRGIPAKRRLGIKSRAFQRLVTDYEPPYRAAPRVRGALKNQALLYQACASSSQQRRLQALI